MAVCGGTYVLDDGEDKGCIAGLVGSRGLVGAGGWGLGRVGAGGFNGAVGGGNTGAGFLAGGGAGAVRLGGGSDEGTTVWLVGGRGGGRLVWLELTGGDAPEYCGAGGL